MSATFKSIEPGPFHPEVFLDGWMEAMEETIEEADELFARTYVTWEEPPNFDREVKKTRKAIKGSVTTDSKIYRFLTRGTSVRYAHMTGDFEAKTHIRTLGNSLGRGGLAYIDRTRPLPGIEARQFEEEVKDQVEKPAITRFERATNEAAKRSGHAL